MRHPVDICIGANLHLLRLKSGYSIDEAAILAKIDPDLWRLWEQGAARLDVTHIWLLKKTFDFNPSDLYIGIMTISDEK